MFTKLCCLGIVLLIVISNRHKKNFTTGVTQASIDCQCPRIFVFLFPFFYSATGSSNFFLLSIFRLIRRLVVASAQS